MPTSITQSLLPTAQRTVEYVIDQTAGREAPAEQLLPSDDRGFSVMRQAAFDANAANLPALVCAGCHQRIYPKHGPGGQSVTFTHFAAENAFCPYQGPLTPENLVQIDRMRYNGAKEGPDHLRVKDLLRRSIEADPRFQGLPRIERNWYGATDPTKWRRPDVAATFLHQGHPLKIAFEIQLSSTYLHVIAERRKFYLEDNSLLFWVFQTADQVDPQQYQKDLFYNNNSNLFVVNEETLEQSMAQNRLIFKCHYLEPAWEGGELVETLRDQPVAIEQLQVDLPTQRVFFFDNETARKTAIQQGLDEWEARDRREIRRCWGRMWQQCKEEGFSAIENEYALLANLLRQKRVDLPPAPSRDSQRLYYLIASAEQGKGVGVGQNWTLLQVANHAERDCKDLCYYFYRAMRHHRRWEQLFQEDDKAAQKQWKPARMSWRDRQKEMFNAIKAGRDGFRRNESLLGVFRYLYPEIGKD